MKNRINIISYSYLIFFVIGLLSAQYPCLSLIPNELESENHFGWEVSVYENRAVVSSPKNDNNGFSSGSVDAFLLNGSNWQLEQSLIHSDAGHFDYFGHSMDLGDSVLAVGAPGAGNNGPNSGAVYIFMLSDSGWVENVKLLPDDGNIGDHFGRSISIEGKYIVIGAHQGFGNASRTGCVYIYVNNNGSWEFDEKIFANNGSAYDRFGSSVAISSTDMYYNILVGAYYKDSQKGSAYLFQKEREDILLGNEIVNDIDNNPTFHSFVQKGKIKGEIDKNKIQKNEQLISKKYKDNHKRKMMIKKSSLSNSRSNWEEVFEFQSNDGLPGNFFGNSVSIDGDKVLIGSYLASGISEKMGAAYLFTKTIERDTWVQIMKFNDIYGGKIDHFGSRVLIDNDAVYIGAPYHDLDGKNAGLIYYWNYVNDTWTMREPISSLEKSDNDYFGLAFDVHDRIILAGSRLEDSNHNNGGSAYAYWPDIQIQPFETSLDSLVHGTIGYDSLSISNFSNSQLSVSIASENEWLIINTPEEEMDPQSTFVIDFMVDASSLEVGAHSSNIIISSSSSNMPDFNYLYSVQIIQGGLTLNDDLVLPKEFSLSQNFPNPFNPLTTLQYTLPKDSKVTLRIFNIIGREVNVLVNERQKAGYKSILWNGSNTFGKPVSSGIYIYILQADNFIQSRKMIMLK